MLLLMLRCDGCSFRDFVVVFCVLGGGVVFGVVVLVRVLVLVSLK